MAFKPNYRQQRSERERAKDIKKQEKLAKREEEAAKRRAERGEGDGSEVEAGDAPVGAGGNDPADDTAAGEAAAPVETVTGGRDPQA
ncbi:MAG: hypothetical protein SGJ07_13495 [Rhodospirillaceae bacterium]|nr:hypothetical protein [Rhodospirillaceae bacterium]